MTDSQFMDLAEALLKQIEAGCDRMNDETEVDIDNQRVGGMITITFASGSQIVVNLQPPLHEIWLAAKSGGYHYQFDGRQWMDTKGTGELLANLSHMASEQAGARLTFTS